MIDTRLILALTIAVNIAIGVVVLLSNPNRKQNVFLFIFSMVFAVWGLLVLVIISSYDAAVAEFFIRLVSYFSTLIPVAFNLLCLAIANPHDTFRSLIRRSRALIVASQLVGLVSFTPFFITEVITHNESGQPLPFPEAVYGPAFPLHSLYFLMFFLLIIVNFIRHMRRSEGVQHEEFRFIILGMSVSATVGVTTNILIPYLTGSSQSQPLGPLSTVAMNAIVAYGIATSRILDVGYILRRAAAYMLLTAQLAVLYAACWYGLSVLLEPVSGDFPLPHMLAAIIVALSLAPAHGRMQQFANRLFINYPTANVEETIALANHVLQSITTLDDLLARFARVIQQALGTDRIAILLEHADAHVQAYPPPIGSDDITLTNDDPLIDTLREAERPLVADLLVRERQTRHLRATTEQMKKMNAAAAVGIRTKGELDGVLILGPRLSGRIYGLMEQNLLQLLCNQLAVALENAKLLYRGPGQQGLSRNPAGSPRQRRDRRQCGRHRNRLQPRSPTHGAHAPGRGSPSTVQGPPRRVA